VPRKLTPTWTILRLSEIVWMPYCQPPELASWEAGSYLQEFLEHCKSRAVSYWEFSSPTFCSGGDKQPGL